MAHFTEIPRTAKLLDATVVIATRNHEQLLQRALGALSQQQFHGKWELIVVDNGSADSTNQVLTKMQSKLPLVCLQEPVPGKSRALNKALDRARGTLIIFTDDDILMLPTWISEIMRASHSYPDARIFCGPIIPIFPPNTPSWLREHPFSGVGMGKFMPPFPEGPLPKQWVPGGGNFAVRATAVNGLRFRVDLGPSACGNLMGEDTDFVESLCHKPEQLIFIPTASVQHCVRAEAVAISALQERAFNSGRSIMIIKAKPIFIEYASLNKGDQSGVRAFEITILRNFYLGQLYQADLDCARQHCQSLIDEIKRFGWPEDVHEICPLAAEWLSTRLALLSASEANTH